jgi:hypothetical protein
MRLYVHAVAHGGAQWISELDNRIDAALNALLETLD